MRRIRLIPGTPLVTMVAAVLTVTPDAAAVPTGATLVVDRDRAQCASDGFTIALSLRADDAVVQGLVVEGASVGIDADDRFSGYRIDHNLLRLNTLFGIDLGSEGTKESRVDHNCLRENQFGLVSELDDDSLWKLSDGPEHRPPERDAERDHRERVHVRALPLDPYRWRKRRT